jgi:hypothetical protein
MTTTTSVHELIKAALIDGDVAAVDGPAKKLPTNADGTIAQAAVLWPAPRLNQYTRQSGTRSGGTDRVTITCVGATTRDALAVADKVEAAIGGMVLSPKGNPLRQTLVTDPAPEPNANPVRVSLAVEYSTITKG